MSVSAILTTRQLSNENTGLDIFVTGDLEGCFVVEVDKVEYTIVVVSNLDALQSSRKLQSNSTLQYSIRRTHAACEQLSQSLAVAFPHFDVPEIPKLYHEADEGSTDACYRQKRLTKFFNFCAQTSALVHSKELLCFLGIIPEMEENHKHKSEKKRKKSKRISLDLFNDDTVQSPDIKESVFTESEHSSSPFDFFHRNRKKKNSVSEKSPKHHYVSMFKGVELDDNGNSKSASPAVVKSNGGVEEDEDDDLNDLENLLTSIKDAKIDFVAKPHTPKEEDVSNASYDKFEDVSVDDIDIQQYISSNITPGNDIATLDL